ncbi:uncharacterized protein LOC144451517 [Glandiceps talaboti]
MGGFYKFTLFAAVAAVVWTGLVESQCLTSQFRCGDGKCIDNDLKCNRIPNCRDLSDEFNCHTLPCQYLGIVRVHEELWEPNVCSTCQCINSTTTCVTITCPFPRCPVSDFIIPEGKCCPYCKDSLPEVTINELDINLEEDTELDEDKGDNELTFDLDVKFAPSSTDLDGKRMWRLSAWGSKSPTGRGKQHSFAKQVLKNRQVSVPLQNGQPMVFEKVTYNMNMTSTLCIQVKYLCVELSKSSSTDPEFKLLAVPEKATTQCELLPCNGVIITGRSFALEDDVTVLDNNADNVISLHAFYYSAAISRKVVGEYLWKLSLYGNTQVDGSGSRIGHVDQILTPRQQDQDIHPGSSLQFTPVVANLDLTGVLCADVPYICVTLSRGEKPKPRYTLTAYPDDRVLTECVQTPCTSDEFRVTYSYVKAPDSTSITENEAHNIIVFDAVFNSDSTGKDAVSGSNLWQLDTWLSDVPEGFGPRHSESQQVLTSAQRNQYVRAGSDLTFTGVRADFDARGLTCDRPKYMCAELSMDPQSTGDFDLVGVPSDSTLRMCDEIDCQDVTTKVRIVDTRIGLIGAANLVEGERDQRIRVNVDVQSSFSSDDIIGDDLWKLTTSTSSSPDGQRNKYVISENVLTGAQDDQDLYAGATMTFEEVTTNIDMTGRFCSEVQYFCVELNRGLFAVPEYEMEGLPQDKVDCVPLSCAQPVKTPRLQIVETAINLIGDGKVVEGERSNSVRLNVDIASSSNSDDVIGDGLWKLSGSTSSSPDGQRNKNVVAENLLSGTQEDRDLYAGTKETFQELAANIDMAGQYCNEVQYFCVELTEGLFAVPEYEMSGLPEDRADCVPLACAEGATKQTEIEEIDIRLIGRMILTEGDDSNPVYSEVDVISSRDSDDIIGDDLWKLTVFTSSTPDGGSDRFLLSENALTGTQQDQDLYAGIRETFRDLNVNIDMRGRTCEAVKFLCVEISQSSSATPPFEMAGPPRNRVKCIPLPCDAIAAKQFRLQDINTRLIGATMLYEGDTSNPITANVYVTSSLLSDDIIGDDLWEMVIFTSSTEDGNGNKRVIANNALTGPQQSRDIYSGTREAFQNLAVNIDMRARYCQYVQYVCVELRKNQLANPEFEVTGSAGDYVRCVPIQCTIRGSVCARDETPCQDEGCVKLSFVCDGDKDCIDGSDEANCGTSSPCEPNEFVCFDSSCVQKTWVCDGEPDCFDGSDEYNCPRKVPGARCESWEFPCSSGECLPASYHCDMQEDCTDGSDELNCGKPVIVTPPVELVRVEEGQTVTLTCVAVGTPTPIISWRLNWGHIPNSDRVDTITVNGRGVLTITNVQSTDAGAYSCEAMNNKGNTFAIPDGVVAVIPSAGVCQGSFFNADAVTTAECVRCFCFGLANQCESSTYFVTQEKILHSDLGQVPQGTQGVQLGNRLSATSVEPVDSRYLQIQDQTGELIMWHFTRVLGSGDFYWMLPSRFLGNQLASYGGTLEYSIRYQPAAIPTTHDIADCIISGSGITLAYTISNQPAQNSQVRRSVEFREFGWMREETGRSDLTVREPATRADLMRVLANIDTFLIRASYQSDMTYSSIGDISFDTAIPQPTGQPRAVFVEDCQCPRGFTGLSCENRAK